ncbi:hypothetical protein EVG20_g10813, partial [Dentipellis fragilis]
MSSSDSENDQSSPRKGGVVKKIKKPYLYVKAHLAPKHHEKPAEDTPPSPRGPSFIRRLSRHRSLSTSSPSPSPPPPPPRSRTTSFHSFIHRVSLHSRSSSSAHTMSEDHQEDVLKSRDLLSSPHARSVSFQDRSSITSSVTPSAAHPAEPVLAPVESAPEPAESVPAPAESVPAPVESAPVESVLAPSDSAFGPVSEPAQSVLAPALVESVSAPAESVP